MIAYLKGNVISKTEKTVILVVNNLGYQIFLSPLVLEKTKQGSEVEFFIYPHIKEDAWDLYGFTNSSELEFFKLLLTVSGIGPKSALNIVSGAKINDIKKAIASGNEDIFQKVTGVSRKIAEKIVMELKNKVAPDAFSQKGKASASEDNLGDWQTIEALLALGYADYQARAAIKQIPENIKEVNERVREALKILGKK